LLEYLTLSTDTYFMPSFRSYCPKFFSPAGKLPTRALFIVAFVSLLSGCATVKYEALEKVGIHNRDILVDRVRDAQTAQSDTKQQFVSAYDEFKSLVSAGDSELEAGYERLSKTVKKSEQRAEDLDSRISAVERVATDLFAEWQTELGEYTNQALKKASAENLETTRRRYESLRKQMRQAQSRVTPVLQILQDNTLFLKHNLNASAVSGMGGEVARIEAQIGKLIADMEKSIASSKEFVDKS
jgi:hypothetical protein